MRQSDGNLLATVSISFGGRPNDIVREELEVAISGKGIEFVDPDGPDDGSIVRYRGVRTGQGMRGVAEILTDDHSLYSIGEWDLQKEH